MKDATTLVMGILIGVLACGGIAYWYYVKQLEENMTDTDASVE